MIKYEDLAHYLSAHENFLFIPHEDPDGDTFGAALGLAIAFRKLNKRSYMFLPKPLSFGLQFLQPLLDSMGNNFVWSELPRDLSRVEQVIYFDCADPQLVQKSNQLIGTGDFTTVNIDHHIDNKKYADINFIDATCASTTQVIYNLLRVMNVELDKNIMLPLYTGLVTDTGNFAYSNTDDKVFEMAQTALAHGVESYNVYRYVYEETPLDVMMMLGEALTRVQLEANNKVAWVYIPQQLIDKYNGVSSYSEIVVNHLRGIRGVEVALVIRPSGNQLRISLRSKGDVKVNQIAAMFQGGGHEKAAGCKINLNSINADNAIANLIAKVNEAVGQPGGK